MKRLTFLALVVCGLFSTLVHAADSPVYELRIYTCNEGKLDALLARFRDHTCKLFEKHGMKNIMYWTPTDEKTPNNTLTHPPYRRAHLACGMQP